MAGERFDIIVVDKIQASIVTKLNAIGKAALAAGANVTLLNTRLAALGVGTTVAATRGAALVVVMDKTGRSVTRTSQAVRGLNTGFLPLIRNFRTIASIAAIIGATRGFVSSIDAFTELQNKLKNVTDSQEQLVDVTNQVARVARDARVPIGDIGKAFQRFDIAVQSLGGSQKESLRITETVSKLLTLQGATVNEARSALLQLSQAFNKGKLDGDEFRSVMELMPRAALEIQRTLGITRAELFKFAEEGRITSNVLRVAFSNLAIDVDRAFSRTTITLGQSLTVLGNAFVIFFGKFDQQIGLTRTLSSAFINLADNLNAVAKAAGAAAIAIAIVFAPKIIAGAIALVTILSPITTGLIAITAILIFFRDKIRLTKDGLVSLQDVAVGIFNFFRSGGGFLEFIKEESLIVIKGVIELFKLLGGFIKFVINSVIALAFAIKNLFTDLTPTDALNLLVDAFRVAWVIVLQIVQSTWNAIFEFIVEGIRNLSREIGKVFAKTGQCLNQVLKVWLVL